MKKFLFILLFTHFYLFTVPLSVSAQFNETEATETNDAVPVSEEVIEEVEMDEGPHFRFEDVVVMNEDLFGDVYVGGETVRIEGNIYGDLFVGGETVIIDGYVSEDVRIGAGKVFINGTIDGNVLVGAGEVVFGPESKVLGTVLAGTRKTVFEGVIEGKVQIGTSELESTGSFGHSLIARVGKGVLSSGTYIERDVDIKAEDKLAVDPDVIIDGERKIVNQEKKRDGKDFSGKEAEAVMKGMDFGWTVMMFISSLIGGGLALFLFPRQMRNMATTAYTRALASLGWGFIKLIMTPIIIIFLFVTLIGFPFALILLFAYIVTLMVAGWVSSYALGEWIATKVKHSLFQSRYVRFTAGLSVLTILGIIPVFGDIVQGLAFIIGIGAIVLAEKNYISQSMKYHQVHDKKTVRT